MTRDLHHRVGAHEMVPPTSRAHLNVVPGEVSRQRTDPIHVKVGHDAAPRRWQARAEHVQDLDETLFATDRTQRLYRHAALTSVSHELALGVADFGAGCFTGSIRTNGSLPSEAKVERATGAVGMGAYHLTSSRLSKVGRLMMVTVPGNYSQIHADLDPLHHFWTQRVKTSR